MASIESALRKAAADLNAIGVRWALVGGLAVSARTIPRFTKDLDFAVAVGNEPERRTSFIGSVHGITNLWKCLSRTT